MATCDDLKSNISSIRWLKNDNPDITDCKILPDVMDGNNIELGILLSSAYTEDVVYYLIDSSFADANEGGFYAKVIAGSLSAKFYSTSKNFNGYPFAQWYKSAGYLAAKKNLKFDKLIIQKGNTYCSALTPPADIKLEWS